MSRVQVLVEPAGAHEATVRTVLGSLPRSFVPVQETSSTTWVAAVDGTPGWAERAAELAERGAACVVVLLPSPSPSDVPRPPVPTVVQTPWSGNPGVTAGLAELVPQGTVVPEGPRLVECRVVAPSGADMPTLLAGQFSLLRATLGPVEQVRHVSTDDSGHRARVLLADGTGVTVSAVLTDAVAPHARLLAVGASAELNVTVPWWTAAVPASVTCGDGAVLRTGPLVYESAARATWRRVHRLVTDGGDDDLAGWSADGALAVSAALGVSAP